MASRTSGADEGYGAPRHRNMFYRYALGTNYKLVLSLRIRYPRLVRPPGRALALDARRRLASRPEAQEIVRISTQLHALRKLSGREPRTHRRHTQTARAHVHGHVFVPRRPSTLPHATVRQARVPPITWARDGTRTRTGHGTQITLHLHRLSTARHTLTC
mgnify:CR=1 FL=1